MLIGRPLLRRCCSPSSKLPDTRLSSTNLVIAISHHGYRQPAGIASSTIFGSRVYLHWGVVRTFSTDEGYQDGPGRRGNSSRPRLGLHVKSTKRLSLPTKPEHKVDIPPELEKDVPNPVADNSWDDFDDFEEPGPNSRLLNNRDRQADEEFFAILDKQRRERASQLKDSVKGAGPSTKTLEDTSRFLLSELLAKDVGGKPGYKKGDAVGDSESDLALLQTALNISVTRIQKKAKPGYHPLPFYLHQNSKALDDALRVVLQERQPAIVNKVCYNLLVSDASPSITTFNILLRRFTRLRMTALARVILSTLFAIGFEPNAYTYAAILQYLTITRNYEAFNRAVQIMRDTFLDYKNPVLGAAELNGWSKLGNFMGMRRRLRLLQEEGLRDDIYILAIELRYFAKRHMWEGGLPALTLLLKKEPQDIDQRALYWAFKLCANCQQHEFANRLKEVAQEKRWPVEVLWTRPGRTRGLPYGYVGRESGQRVPKGTDPPQWTELWNPGVKSKETWELQKPNLKMMARVPEDWREYSSAFWEKANGQDGGIELKSWRASLADGSDSLTSDVGVGGSDAEILGSPTSENEPLKLKEPPSSTKSMGKEGRNDTQDFKGNAMKPSIAPESIPKRAFKSLEEDNVWKSLLKRRKRELLRPETRGPKPR
ncbi:hypothetical protein TWF730_010310 [Orbilia blumenaviensis]|uniref:Uncharacterized protein n=1 Tax=Orbilia blumenaviensis TaxID=1796055 RepID=A0AAV9UPF4_9PEZI